MKSKKIIACLLITVMLLSLVLTSCSSGNIGNNDKSGGNSDSSLETEAHTHKIVEYSRVDATYTEEGSITYRCTTCDYEITETIPMLTHSYSEVLSYDESTHWYPCLDDGCEDVRSNEEAHAYVLVENSYNEATGYADYSCKCGYTVSRKQTSVTILPTLENDVIYIGQSLSSVTLIGGEANVEGSFAWVNGSTLITQSGDYEIVFTPTNAEEYAALMTVVHIDATQLTVTVTTGANGSADPSGTVNVDYGSSLSVTFKADLGYAVASISLDGATVGAAAYYTISDIKESHTLHAEFEESEMTLSIDCVEGTAGCYSVSGSTITFTSISADSIYSISGELNGNIVIDVGDDYKFELEMQGFTMWCEDNSPITILSGDKVTLTAKKSYTNFIHDLRERVSEDDETQYAGAIHAECDLDIGGKGSLTVESKNNNGIHTKDDLEVKNLTLTVSCVDNALKGNDSVTIKSGTLKLIATQGDGIKTSNTDVSDKGNQRGTVEILGGAIDIYAACDGIDAAYDVVINENEATVSLNVFTDQYSEYSEEVSVTSRDTYYIRYSSKNYSYSIKWYNSDTDYKWVNAEYYTSVSGGKSTYYYYSIPIETDYSSFKFFMYSSTQQQGSEKEYAVCSDYIAWNTACDTFALSQRGNSLTYSWTNYTTSSSGGGMGGMGGMQDGNSNKSEYSTKGLKAGNAITISAGNVNIKAYDDAIHANADTTLENGATPTGNVNVSGGTLTLYSADDGIHADGTLSVSGGSINITKCYEGLEGAYIHVTNGSVSIVSSDDGMNSPATSGTGIQISGGTVYIYAGGDGIDSNSRTSYKGIVFEGGNVIVISTSNGNSAIDTEAGYAYTGGSVLALMPNGGMTDEATKCQSSTITKKTISLSSGSYLTVTVSSKTVVTVKMPCSLSAMAIYLGSSSATVSSSSSSSATLDGNGVCWN